MGLRWGGVSFLWDHSPYWFHIPSNCRSRYIKSILVTNVLCLHWRTTPAATQRYEFWLAHENIARSISVCHASNASLRFLSNGRRHNDSLTGISWYLTNLFGATIDVIRQRKVKKRLGSTSKNLIIHAAFRNHACQRISKMVIKKCYIEFDKVRFWNRTSESAMNLSSSGNSRADYFLV